MSLKSDLSHQTSRTRHHYIKKFKKAYHYSLQLLNIDHKNFDNKTTLEIQCYHYILYGIYLFEIENYKLSYQQLIQANLILDKLITNIKNQSYILAYKLFKKRIRNYIRYAKSQLEDDDHVDNTNFNEMNQLTKQLSQTKLAANSNQLSNIITYNITWNNEIITHTSQKLNNILLKCQSYQLELNNLTSSQQQDFADYNEQFELLTKYYMLYDDAITLIKKLMIDTRGDDLELKKYQTISSYLLYNKILLIYQRNQLLLTKKNMKLDSKIKIYDKLINNIIKLKEINNNFDDDEQLLPIYKAKKCFYLAKSYTLISSYDYAVLLYNRTIELLNNKKKISKELNELKNQCKIGIAIIQAQAILNKSDNNATTNDNNKDQAVLSLLERINVYDNGINNNSNIPTIIQYPPKLRPVQAKPILFDLAYNAIDFNYEQLEQRVNETQQGLLGKLKSFW